VCSSDLRGRSDRCSTQLASILLNSLDHPARSLYQRAGCFSMKDLSSLFRQAFDFEALDRHASPVRFYCPSKEICKVDVNRDPIYTPYLGDADSTVMAVAEAPSDAGRFSGPVIGGTFAQLPTSIEDNRASPIVWARNFVQFQYGTIPHFTDCVKCGLTRQRRRSLLLDRFDHCRRRFLSMEIYLLRPSVILCFGRSAERQVQLALEEVRMTPRPRLVYLAHYSKSNCQNHKCCEECARALWSKQLAMPSAPLHQLRRKGPCPHKDSQCA